MGERTIMFGVLTDITKSGPELVESMDTGKISQEDFQTSQSHMTAKFGVLIDTDTSTGENDSKEVGNGSQVDSDKSQLVQREESSVPLTTTLSGLESVLREDGSQFQED